MTGGDCDDTEDASYPAAAETCNQVDDDCDGLTDEDFAVKTCGFGLCQKMVAECALGGSVQACIADQPDVADQDLCDNLDDDCDGKVDEGASRFCDDLGTLGKCTSGLCEILGCNAGYADCNAFDPDGCEVSLLDNAAHCGECGNSCAFGDTCANGKCQHEPLSIAAGQGHTCVVLGSGDVYCWGLNASGQSGSALSSGVLLKATKVANLGPALTVSAKTVHTCALLQDHTAACWGFAYYYALGSTSTADTGMPVAVAGAASILEIEAGHVYTCWRSSAGSVYCFGAQCHNRLGYSNSSTDCNYRTAASSAGSPISGTSMMSLGHAHGLVRISSGNTSLQGWGYDGSGQLAAGGTNANGRAVGPLGNAGAAEITNAVDLATGQNITCAVLGTGKVMCSGSDLQGELGDDATLSSSIRMVEVAGISNAKRVWANYNHVCAQLADASVMCWGRNDSRQLLADTATFQQPVPIAIDTLPGQVVEMAMGEQHTCAILSTKRVACWGSNAQGQLGDNTGLARPGAVLVSGLP
jgi:alpha-tubulin suppressor-like RCC1 family protein